MKKAGNDTSALEREIDGLVYGLYRLSEGEIKTPHCSELALDTCLFLHHSQTKK
jgi:hypothetical protein